MRITLPSRTIEICPSCGRPMRRILNIDLLDFFGVTFLSLFLGGVAWLLISAGALWSRAGVAVVGTFCLIWFVSRYFLRASILEHDCPIRNDQRGS